MSMLEYITPMDLQHNIVYIDSFSAGQADMRVMNCS